VTVFFGRVIGYT